ncbi:baseplate complex protein [Grimontia sp. NTOU-MAR1]|uniref:baseplate complex protein n=1 Tax=Grimontia sp. NTOU-MAR1 TaxID=3111011 RepID=UPI002DB666DB|nr:adenine glycosylase [Grimontia sp. NTOU-MAR1]WRV96529.1 adenine glycosylase [Grimontia sp. NTOU-MAR1]
MLNLSGQRVPLKGLKVTARQQLAGQDMSGSSAATDQAETGDKTKVLAVTGTIPFKAAPMLNQLFTLAGAKEAAARVVYRITNPTADALKIRQVKFQGTLTAREDMTLRQWVVAFELVEHLSVAERTEKREPPTPAAQQKATGMTTPTTTPTASDDVPPDTDVEMTGFMGVLHQIENALP